MAALAGEAVLMRIEKAAFPAQAYDVLADAVRLGGMVTVTFVAGPGVELLMDVVVADADSGVTMSSVVVERTD